MVAYDSPGSWTSLGTITLYHRLTLIVSPTLPLTPFEPDPAPSSNAHYLTFTVVLAPSFKDLRPLRSENPSQLPTQPYLIKVALPSMSFYWF